MFESLRLDYASDWLIRTAEWFANTVFDRWVFLQLLLLAAAFIVTKLVTPRLIAVVKNGLGKITVRPRFQAVVDAALAVFSWVVFVLLLWLVVGVMEQLTWPSRSYWIGVVASLMTAWVVIRLLTAFVHNATIARALAIAVWTVAALDITGLLNPTIEVLDSFAFRFGEMRISLLTVVKGFISLALLLWVAAAISRMLETRISHLQELTPSIQVLLSKLLKITLLTLAVIVAMNSVGIDLTGLALFSGAIGLGIGFGLQKVVSNLISGVILLLDKSIKPGDVIELGETFGWISSLGARYVSVVTRDGKEYLIPNEDLITQRVVNWSFSSEYVRQEVKIGVSYDSNPHQVRELLVSAARTPSRVASEPSPVCHLVGFGDSSLDFVLRFWIRDPRNGVVNVRGEVLLAVWDALKENGIGIPYPHRQIVFTNSAPQQDLQRAAG